MSLELLTAANITVPHGFTTRWGGVSESYYGSLNLGLSTGDDRAVVATNRERVLAHFGVTREAVCVLEQVHGARVVEAEPSWYGFQADAATTDDPDLLLVIGVADCQPILFVDPVQRAVAAAHAGWRGTVKGIAGNVVKAMAERYGSNAADMRVAFGPCIAGACYQVGPEVAGAFEEAGFPAEVLEPDSEGRYRLDIGAANRCVLKEAGVAEENITDLGLCTHCDRERFYSHRRDGRRRGSHWAAIKLPQRRR